MVSHSFWNVHHNICSGSGCFGSYFLFHCYQKIIGISGKSFWGISHTQMHVIAYLKITFKPSEQTNMDQAFGYNTPTHFDTVCFCQRIFLNPHPRACVWLTIFTLTWGVPWTLYQGSKIYNLLFSPLTRYWTCVPFIWESPFQEFLITSTTNFF